MVRVFLLLAFLAGNTASAETDAAGRVAEIEAQIGGRIGVTALDTRNSKRFDYRAEERFPMCSTFKFLAATAVLKRVERRLLRCVWTCSGYWSPVIYQNRRAASLRTGCCITRPEDR